MIICFLADASSLHTYRWIQYFAGKGHQVHLISFQEFSYNPIENLSVNIIKPILKNKGRIFSYLANKFVNIFINPIKVKKMIRTINPDILHAHYLTDYGLLGYFMHFPVSVISVWGSDILIEPKKSFFRKIMAKLIINSSKLVTCDSNSVRNECLKYCKHPEKIEIILGVDLSTFRERKNYLTKYSNFIILSSRGFRPIYNVDSIVKSIPYVIEKYPNVKYILKTLPGSQNPELQQLAVSLNVIKNTEFISKMIDFNELPEMLFSVDIFISVPSSDSSSISLLEAMACGLPVIVSDIPANHEWIIDGWNGFIVPIRNPEKLANAIIQLIEKPDLMQIFGERNAQIIRDRADREKNMAHMENLYQQLIEKYK